MKLLLENWREYLDESKLRVFDFDDTLAVSDSKVVVVYPDNTSEELTPEEFADHEYKPYENKYDFSQFDEVINPVQIRSVVKRLRGAVKAGGKREIVILTARSQKAAPAIRGWLKSIGIDTSKIKIVGLEDPNPQKKANWIEDRIKSGADDVLFLDDSQKNVDIVALLGDKYPEITMVSDRIYVRKQAEKHQK